GRPIEIEKVLISTQHKDDGLDADTLIKPDLYEHVLHPILPAELYDERKLLRNFLVNPTGKFVIGGPMGDAGLTGRKIIVDTYGGMARTVAGRSRARTPRRWTARPRTPPGTWPRTAWRPAWPTAWR